VLQKTIKQQFTLKFRCNWVSSSVPGEPWCTFDPNLENFAGYNLDQIVSNTSTYLLANLFRRNTPTLFGNDDRKIRFRIQHLGQNELMVSVCFTFTIISLTFICFITFQFIPFQRQNTTNCLSHFQKEIKKKTKKFVGSPNYKIDLQESPFGIRITRRSTGQIM